MRAALTRIGALIAAALTLVLAFAPGTAGAQERIRVLTWNVQGGTAGDGREPDMETLAAVLREGLPDVVGLQEVCRQTVHRPRFLQMLAAMGYSRPVHAEGTTARVRRRDGEGKFRCDYGTALFVRGRVEAERQRELFPRDANGRPERRRVSCVQTVIGRRLWFCNTHVARRGDRDRDGDPITQRQIESLARRTGRLDGPVVLVGDLNRKPQRDSPLARQFDEIDQHNRPTLGGEKYDYILYTPRDFRRAGVGFLDPDLVETDHRGMLGTLRFK
jgi:endonuclease/exonuclease/phosphatase family metal-dependent hydrolase